MAGMTSVKRIKMGDAIGTANRVVWVALSDARATDYGTVKVRAAYPPPPPPDDGISVEEPRVVDREWLHGGEARVCVREPARG